MKTIQGHEVRQSQYVVFDTVGRVIRVCDFLTNGLGVIYQLKADLTLVRIIF